MVAGHYWIRAAEAESIAYFRPREPEWKVAEDVCGNWTLLGHGSVIYWREADGDIEVLAGPLSISVEQTVNALQRRIERAVEELSRESMGMTVRALEILKGQGQ